MGVCANCIYIGHVIESKFENEENYTCECIENAEVNHINGETRYSDCYTKNRFGECLFYKKISPALDN